MFKEFKITEGKRLEIMKNIGIIELNLESYIEAMRKYAMGFADKKEVMLCELNLRNSVFIARDIFNELYTDQITIGSNLS